MHVTTELQKSRDLFYQIQGIPMDSREIVPDPMIIFGSNLNDKSLSWSGVCTVRLYIDIVISYSIDEEVALYGTVRYYHYHGI